jgi:hypothetical protein
MKFQIIKIVLWPRNSSFPPREVSIRPEALNVISGASRTGKSAIIPIIDYCLGAERCAIPVETIRDACSWFGLVVETEDGQKLFARREPGGQKTTGDMFAAEGDTVEVPRGSPIKNTTADAVKARLDELSGLSRLDFDSTQSGSGFKFRPSFRDLMAFTFQPQNIVANPDVLYFKADTYEHREKLKTIFPYVLQAVTPDILAAQHELESLRRDLSRKERELENLRRVSERWVAELRAQAVQAREFGLLDEPIPENAERSQLLLLLEAAVQRRERVTPTAEGISEAMDEILSLRQEETLVDGEFQALRRRLGEMSKLKDNASRFKDALAIQRDRLAIATWLHSLEDQAHICPVCETQLSAEAPKLHELLRSLADIEAEATRAGSVPVSFDREMIRVKHDIELRVERLRGIAIRKAEVESRSESVRIASYRESEIARFSGRIERALEMQKALGQDGMLAAEVDELKKRVQALEKLISKAGLAARQKRALDKVAMFAGRILPDLDTERPDDPIELSITDLSVKVKGASREDYLWEIGSGANWLSYHVAVSLALQQFFIDSSPSPIPGFLVYDQPSQVYFPRRLAHSGKVEEPEPEWQDEDVDAVRKVLAVLMKAVAGSKGRLQVLVLDHAGPDVWNGLQGVHLVEEWRGGKKLVPTDWL